MARQRRRHRDRFECHRDGGRSSCGPGLGDGHGRAWGLDAEVGIFGAAARPGGEHFGDRYRHEPDGFGRERRRIRYPHRRGHGRARRADDVLLQYGGPVGRGDGLHLHLRPSGGDALGGGLYRDRRRLGRRHTGLRCHHPRHLRRFDCNGDGAVEQSVSMPASASAPPRPRRRSCIRASK